MIIPNNFVFHGVYKCKRCGVQFKAEKALVKLPIGKNDFFELDDGIRGTILSNEICPQLKKYNPVHSCYTLKYDYGVGELVGFTFEDCYE